MIRGICILSVLCSVLCSIAPAGTVKTVMTILSSIILMLMLLEPVKAFDFHSYAQELAKYKELEYKLLEEGNDVSSRLNRLVIEDEYSAYIKDKAADENIMIQELKVQLEWNTDGYWVPESMKAGITSEEAEVEKVIGTIAAELGISPEKQYWYVIG